LFLLAHSLRLVLMPPVAAWPASLPALLYWSEAFGGPTRAALQAASDSMASDALPEASAVCGSKCTGREQTLP
jgi:hypothetical protein